jgi:hypothetical protein
MRPVREQRIKKSMIIEDLSIGQDIVDQLCKPTYE